MTGIDLSGVTAYIEANILLDTVRITKQSATEPIFNPDTGQYDHPEPVVVYEGPGAVQTTGTPGGVSSIPAMNLPFAQEYSSRYLLLTPTSATVPAAGQIVTVVAVHPGGDSALIGRRWRTQDPGKAGTLNPVRITVLDQEIDRTA